MLTTNIEHDINENGFCKIIYRGKLNKAKTDLIFYFKVLFYQDSVETITLYCRICTTKHEAYAFLYEGCSSIFRQPFPMCPYRRRQAQCRRQPGQKM